MREMKSGARRAIPRSSGSAWPAVGCWLVRYGITTALSAYPIADGARLNPLCASRTSTSTTVSCMGGRSTKPTSNLTGGQRSDGSSISAGDTRGWSGLERLGSPIAYRRGGSGSTVASRKLPKRLPDGFFFIAIWLCTKGLWCLRMRSAWSDRLRALGRLRCSLFRLL